MSLQPYTARLTKAGALVDEMRRLCRAWDGEPGCLERVLRENPIASPSRSRLQDVVERGFVPRYVRSNPPDLWKPLALLEEAGMASNKLMPLHYYAAAAADPVLWDFVIAVVAPRHEAGQLSVTVDQARLFLQQAPASRFPKGLWSDWVNKRVARGILAALRDFGLLTGRVKKQITPFYLPVESFCFIAMVRHVLGSRGVRALSDPCWRLFFLSQTAVERFFVGAQQRGFLRYHAAGTAIRVDYPVATLEEYARVLAG